MPGQGLQPVPPGIPPAPVTFASAPPLVAAPPAAVSTARPVPGPELEPEPALAPARKRLPAINWEQFMGVKLLAWVGGLAAFLAVAFFV